jgi:8-amino-7-oxononanoate synthase
MGRTEEIQSAIVPLIIGSETDAIHRSRELFQHGYFVPAIRYPTVAKGAARLRLTFSATHTAEQIDGLAQTLLRLNRTEED